MKRISSIAACIILLLLSISMGGCGVIWNVSPADVRKTGSREIRTAANNPNSGRETRTNKTSTTKTQHPTTERKNSTEGRPSTPNSVRPSSKSESSRTDLLLDIYKEWKGVPYRLGGTTKSGIDCSAFTQMAFRRAFSKEIGRDTSRQFKVGKAVDQDKLAVGDLMLFKTGKNTRHIGIYIGNNQFLHASVTFGVSVADLNNPYWKRRYVGARRVL